MKRRDVLAGLGAASAVGALPGTRLFAQSAAGTCVLTPQTSDGPFYFDPKLLRSDITEDRQGAPLDLQIRVVTAGDCAGIEGARADVWHSDALGLYSGYAGQAGAGGSETVSGKTFLRGTQLTDNSGAVVFKTIYPSWYAGRTPHVHFKIFLDRDSVVTGQIFFPDEMSDQVFGNIAPYRARHPQRGPFNANDMYMRNGVQGAMCTIVREGNVFRAAVDIGVRDA